MTRYITWLKTIEAIYVIAFFCLGLAFIFATPPMTVVDETAHFYRSYQVSENRLLPKNIRNESGGAVPKVYTDLVLDNIRADQYKTTYKEVLNRFLGSNEKTQTRQEVIFTNVSGYPFVNYVPQSTGIRIVRLITDKTLPIFYAGRIFNLLFLTICLGLALRMMPRGKLVLGTLFLLPSTLYVSCSYSADAYVLGVVALWVSYLWRLYGRKIKPSEWIILGALACCVVLAKQGYFLLVLPAIGLSFRNRKFDKNTLLWSGSVLLLSVVALGLSQLAAAGINTRPIDLQHSVGIISSPMQQANFIAHHPTNFIGAVFTTASNQGIFTGVFGVMGTGNAPLPYWITSILFLVVFLSYGVQEKRIMRTNLGRFPQLLFTVSIAGTVLIILLALYILWTPVRNRYIEGVQGRYFIPLLILAIPLIAGWYRHTIKWPPLFIASLVSAGVALYVVVDHFYIIGR